MPFERTENFKMKLSKTVEILSSQEDLLMKSRKGFLSAAKFKTVFLMNQNPEKTEMIYNFAKTSTVLATFEKLKREIMDIHFASCSSSNRNRNLIYSYEIMSDFRTKKPHVIKFTTKLNFSEKVNVVLKMGETPKSAVFPDHPCNKYIRISIGRKIPAEEKLKEAFNQLMNNGGLLIEFITDSLLPLLWKLSEQKKKERQIQEQEKQKEKKKNGDNRNHPIHSRSYSGSERGAKAFSHRNDGHRDERHDRKNSATRGVRIPRCNQQMNTTNSTRIHSSSSRIDSNNQFPPRGRTIGGSFGTRRDSSSSKTSGHGNRQGKFSDGRKGGGTGHGRGSENENWRDSNS